MKIARRFASALEEKGWTNADAARELDCTASYVAGLKQGQVTPGLALAARIERALGISCIFWADEKPAAVGRQGRRVKRS